MVKVKREIRIHPCLDRNGASLSYTLRAHEVIYSADPDARGLVAAGTISPALAVVTVDEHDDATEAYALARVLARGHAAALDAEFVPPTTCPIGAA